MVSNKRSYDAQRLVEESNDRDNRNSKAEEYIPRKSVKIIKSSFLSKKRLAPFVKRRLNDGSRLLSGFANARRRQLVVAQAIRKPLVGRVKIKIGDR